MPTTNDDQHDPLSDFLATNEARCPVCRYNLHAVTSGTCPECGHRPSLGLAQPDVLGRRRGLLLLVFAWLLLAGAMNGYSGARSIHETITRRPQVFTLSSPQLPLGRLIDASQGQIAEEVQVITVETEATSAESPPQSDPDETAETEPNEPAPGAPLHRTASLRFGPESTAPATIPTSISFDTSGAISIVPMATASSWTSVSWTQWASTVWWIVLAVVALAALIALFRYRRREASRRLGTLLMTTGWIAFGGYFAFHVMRFVGEVT